MTSPAERAVNVPLLRKTLEHIEAHPEEWNQAQWQCSTGFCFAGHAAVFDGATFSYAVGDFRDSGLTDDAGFDVWNHEVVRSSLGEHVAVWDYARDALGLADDAAGELFSGLNDLDDLRRIVADLCGGEL